MSLLGQLTVGIIGNASGFSGALTQAQKDTVKFAKGIEGVGKNISTIGQSISGVGDKLTKRLTLPALGAATALAGITLAKGFSRLVSIDTAQAKLKALGHDADSVSVIMDSALASVKGTAFGLGDAATAAASAVAAGIKPGKELTQYLTNVGDAASIAGVEFSDMGSIFNKIQTGGKATRMELNQLADRGLPVFQWLAEAAGESEDAIQEMVTNGEINSELFNKAIEKNIGGAAGIMGAESFTAGAANVWAAVGRIGASFLDAGGKGGGFFSQLKPMMANFTEKIDDMGAIAAEWGVKFGEAVNKVVDKVKDLKAKFDALSPATQDLIKKGALIGGAFLIGIGPVLSIVGSFVSGIGGMITTFGRVAGAVARLGGVMGILTGPVGIVIGIIAALIAIGVLLYKNWDTIKERAEIVFTAFAPLLETVKVAFQNLMSSLGPIWESLKTLFASLKPILTIVGALVGGVLVTAFGLVISVFSAVVSAIGPLINAIINIADIVTNMVNVVIALLTGDFAGAWEYLKKIGESTKDFFINIFTAIVNFISTFIMTIVDFFYGLYMTLVGNSIIPDMVNAIVKWFKDLGKWAVDLVKSLVNKVVQWFTDLYTKAKEKFNNLKSTASTIFNNVKDVITTAIQTAKDKVISFASSLYTQVKTKFDNLKSAAQTVFNAVKDVMVKPIEKARDLISNAIDKVKGFFSGLSLKFPKISMPKLPKFSLDGKFSLAPPSVPKLKVDWFKDGGIFAPNSPRMIGIGDARVPEAALPLSDSVLGKIGQMIGQTMPRERKGDVVINQTINSPNPLTPSDTARLNKRAMQEWALGW